MIFVPLLSALFGSFNFRILVGYFSFRDHLYSYRLLSKANAHGISSEVRLELVSFIFQQGLPSDFLGKDEAFHPIDALESGEVDVELLPMMFMFHGMKEESTRDTKRFEEVLRRLGMGMGRRLWVRYEEIANHGFERDVLLDTPWSQDGLWGITEAWLKL